MKGGNAPLRRTGVGLCFPSNHIALERVPDTTLKRLHVGGVYFVRYSVMISVQKKKKREKAEEDVARPSPLAKTGGYFVQSELANNRILSSLAISPIVPHPSPLWA